VSLPMQLRTLARRLVDLRRSVAELRLTAVEDRPVDPDIALVDRIEDVVTDLQSAVEGAASAAAAAVPRAAGNSIDTEAAGAALSRCQVYLDKARRALWRDLLSYDSVLSLRTVGREHGCEPALDAAGAALDATWRDLAERASLGSVNVRNTTIGQRITVAPDGTPSTPSGGDR
jgi:hypothetical protein